jgi:hypothetical protein
LVTLSVRERIGRMKYVAEAQVADEFAQCMAQVDAEIDDVLAMQED